MSILKINKCKQCKRKAVLTDRKGGWTVDCYYSHPFHAVEDNKKWCDVAFSGKLFNTPNEAILDWNKEN